MPSAGVELHTVKGGGLGQPGGDGGRYDEAAQDVSPLSPTTISSGSVVERSQGCDCLGLTLLQQRTLDGALDQGTSENNGAAWVRSAVTSRPLRPSARSSTTRTPRGVEFSAICSESGTKRSHGSEWSTGNRFVPVAIDGPAPRIQTGVTVGIVVGGPAE